MNRLFTSRALGAAVSATALGGIAHAETIRVGNNKNVEQIRQFENLSVKSVIQETPNVKRVVFHLPDKSIPLGFSAISAVMLKADRPEGLEKATMKPYNPVFHSTPGEFSVCVKKYPNSKMGTVVHALAPGDQLAVKFGWQQFDYQPNKFGKIGMIAGGTGVTPMLQLIESIVTNPEDKTQVTLLFANKSDYDIICKSKLDEFVAAHSDQLKVVYTVEEQKGYYLSDGVEVGRPGIALPLMIAAHMPAPSTPDAMILVCGPGAMVKELSGPKIFKKGKAPQQGPLLGVLKKLGYSETTVTKV